MSFPIVRRSSARLLPWLLALAALLCAAAGARAAGDDDFLPPEQAFRVSVRAADARDAEVVIRVAPGYYLYREPFRFAGGTGVQLAAPQLPAGTVKFDDTFQKNVETYRDELRIRLPVTQAPARFDLEIVSQGCADRGLCYPPMRSVARVSLAGFGGDGSARLVSTGEIAGPAGEPSATAAAGAPAADEDGGDDGLLDRALRSGSLWTTAGVFFVAGLLLSLTPCVLPMLPILSSIVVGGSTSATPGATPAGRRRGIALSLSYSLGMALVYTALGVAAGLAGEGLAAALQAPAVIGGFALLLALLAASMFGAYELRLPARWAERLTAGSQRLPGGRHGAVFAMGGLSALIVSPCVAAPLAGALLYLSQTRDVWIGGSALFFLAMGMSVPLLLLGASAGALLPRAGAWMDGVRRFFGVLLLGVALWLLQPLLPIAATMAAIALLLAVSAVLLWPRRAGAAWPLARRVAAFALVALATLQAAGAVVGGGDPLRPWAVLRDRGAVAADAATPLRFVRVDSAADLEAALRQADRPVMLDFYADWCVSCKEMERFTFTDPAVRQRLAGALLLKADVTANAAPHRELLKRFQLFGPPATLFFDANGRELRRLRVVGYQSADRFDETLQRAGL